MPWVFHDSYKTAAIARKYGEDIVKTGLAKGIKVINKGKKSKPFMLYILATK
jgi:hypothetical protein